MPISACPYCFTKIDTNKLAFQCTNSSGKCTKAEDPRRVELTRNNVETYRTFLPEGRRLGDVAMCTCGSQVRRRACPACHTGLPIEFVGSDSQLIGLVGAKGTGKTVYMTVLVRQLREAISQPFGADVRIMSDNPDGAASLSAYHQGHEDRLFEKLELPPPTAQDNAAARRPIVLRWRQEYGGLLGSHLGASLFSFVDTAGEDLQDLDTVFTLRYLESCDAIIVLLDPFMLPGARSQVHLPKEAAATSRNRPLDVLARITEQLRTQHGVKVKRRVKVPLAVVFPKIDAFYHALDRGNPIMSEAPATPVYDNADGESVHEHVLALLQGWNAGDIDKFVRLNYDTYRYFAVSSLGEQPHYEEMTVRGGGVRPHRVGDPLLWLLALEGGVPKR